MLSMLLILACANAGAGGKTSTEVRLRFVAESLTAPGYSEPFSIEARIDETADTIETITVFIPESDVESNPTDDTNISLNVYLPKGRTLKFTDTDGTAHIYSDQDTPIPLTVDLSDSVRFAVTQAGNPEKIYKASAFRGIPIFDEADLKVIRNIQDGMTKNYFLMNDIALTGNFKPLGNVYSPYTGIFDGRGKTISNLKIVDLMRDAIGFFRQIGNFDSLNAGVQNLVLSLADYDGANPSIEGEDYVGAVAGRNYGKIENVAVIGGMVKGATRVGGLVGEQFNRDSNIIDSHVTTAVMGTRYVGGIVGLKFAGNITNSYTTGRVEGSENAGGLVGLLQGGEINNSYATGDVEGSENAGGLVGSQEGGSITNSYATGAVMGDSEIGGLVGFQRTGTTITSSYFDAILTRTDGQTTQLPGVGNLPDARSVTAFYTVDGVVLDGNRTDAMAVTAENSFSDWNFNGVPAENNGDPIWHLPVNGHWPTLYWQNQ